MLTVNSLDEKFTQILHVYFYKIEEEVLEMERVFIFKKTEYHICHDHALNDLSNDFTLLIV